MAIFPTSQLTHLSQKPEATWQFCFHQFPNPPALRVKFRCLSLTSGVVFLLCYIKFINLSFCSVFSAVSSVQEALYLKVVRSSIWIFYISFTSLVNIYLLNISPLNTQVLLYVLKYKELLLFCSFAQLCLTLGHPIDRSTSGLPVLHQLLEFTQTHVNWVSDAIQPSHPLLSPSPVFNLSQHQGLSQWVSSSHQVAKVAEFQLQQQSFQWIFRTDLL